MNSSGRNLNPSKRLLTILAQGSMKKNATVRTNEDLGLSNQGNLNI